MEVLQPREFGDAGEAVDADGMEHVTRYRSAMGEESVEADCSK